MQPRIEVGIWTTSVGVGIFAYDTANNRTLSHVLGEYDATGAPLYEVIWLGDTPVGVIRTTFSAATYAASTDTIFVDHLNTPRTIVNANGGLWSWAFYEDPYAQITPPATAAGYVFNLRMPGQMFDKETGLFHNGHRDYNPATGRYIQPDPIGLEGGINRYGYVGGNPVMWSDPDGLMGRSPSGSSSQTGGATANAQKAMDCLCKIDTRFCISKRSISSAPPDILDNLLGIFPAGQTNIFGQLTVNSMLFNSNGLSNEGRLFDLFYMMAHEIQHKWQSPADRWLTQAINQKEHDAIDGYAYALVIKNQATLMECFKNSTCK